jgi:hypothetical protein
MHSGSSFFGKRCERHTKGRHNFSCASAKIILLVVLYKEREKKAEIAVQLAFRYFQYPEADWKNS